MSQYNTINSRWRALSSCNVTGGPLFYSKKERESVKGKEEAKESVPLTENLTAKLVTLRTPCGTIWKIKFHHELSCLPVKLCIKKYKLLFSPNLSYGFWIAKSFLLSFFSEKIFFVNSKSKSCLVICRYQKWAKTLQTDKNS